MSINYWRNATDGLRRTLDLSIAKVSFGVYLLFGVFYVHNNVIRAIGWPMAVLLVGAYVLSGHYWKYTKKRWLTYHCLFHLFVVIEQLVIITGSYEECRQKGDSIENLLPISINKFLYWLINFIAM